MINYFDAAEKTLRSRGVLETALENLERRRARIIAQSGPAGYPSPDFSKPYASVGAVNDALSACLELAEVAREIQRTEEAIAEIDGLSDSSSRRSGILSAFGTSSTRAKRR